MAKLDLHGMRYEEARRATDRLANDYCMERMPEGIKIITGHSSNMRKMVTEILEEYSIEYEVGGPLGFDNTYIRIY